MNVITENEQQWGQVNINTWQDLSPHLWECFRWALMETETEQEVQGVVLEYSRAFNEVVTEMETQGVRVEFSPTIVSTTTEMIVNIVVSRRDYKSAMLNYLPPYEKKSVIFNAILNAYDKEFRALEQELDVVDRNMSLNTSIELLHIHERDLAIRNVEGLGYDQRREQISSRYRSSFDQTTEDTIKNVASAYGNGEVDVNKTLVPGVYEIKFIGVGIPNNLDGLKQALDIIIPAHLGIDYVFTFSPWEDLKTRTWGEVATENWNELREWEGVI